LPYRNSGEGAALLRVHVRIISILVRKRPQRPSSLLLSRTLVVLGRFERCSRIRTFKRSRGTSKDAGGRIAPLTGPTDRSSTCRRARRLGPRPGRCSPISRPLYEADHRVAEKVMPRKPIRCCTLGAKEAASLMDEAREQLPRALPAGGQRWILGSEPVPTVLSIQSLGGRNLFCFLVCCLPQRR